MADKPKSVNKVASGLARPGDLYFQGDKLPVPEVEEKNTDSVWSLWSDLVHENPKQASEADAIYSSRERDFLETVPIDRNAMAEAQLMGLPQVPRK